MIESSEDEVVGGGVAVETIKTCPAIKSNFCGGTCCIGEGGGISCRTEVDAAKQGAGIGTSCCSRAKADAIDAA